MGVFIKPTKSESLLAGDLRAAQLSISHPLLPSKGIVAYCGHPVHPSVIIARAVVSCFVA